MLRLKVCGIKNSKNYNELAKLEPDFVGLNFYQGSPRYVEKDNFFDKQQNICLTGVFVNEEKKIVVNKAAEFKLDLIQLHGDEPAEYCAELKDGGMPIIKAFRIDDDFDFSILEPYLDPCTYFLFDTPGEHFGGSGKKFKWDILNHYPYNKPFFLAGGLAPENVREVFQLRLPQLFAIDVNSGYEESPGYKNIDKLKELKKLLTTYDSNKR